MASVYLAWAQFPPKLQVTAIPPGRHKLPPHACLRLSKISQFFESMRVRKLTTFCARISYVESQ